MNNSHQLLVLLDFLRSKTLAEHGFNHPELQFNYSELNNDDEISLQCLSDCLHDLDVNVPLGKDPHSYKLFKSYVIQEDNIVKIYDITTERINEAYRKLCGKDGRTEMISCSYNDETKITILNLGLNRLLDFEGGIGTILFSIYTKRHEGAQDFRTLAPAYQAATNHSLNSQRLSLDIQKINERVKKVTGGNIDILIDKYGSSKINRYKWKII